MKRLLKFYCALLVLAAPAFEASAQDGPPPPGMDDVEFHFRRDIPEAERERFREIVYRRMESERKSSEDLEKVVSGRTASAGTPAAASQSAARQMSGGGDGGSVVFTPARVVGPGNAVSAQPAPAPTDASAVAQESPIPQTESAQSSFVSTARQSDDNSDEALIASLLYNNPFGTAKPAGSVEETLGIFLKSVALMDGNWHFSLVAKDGRSAWLKIGEESSELNCKVVSFDESSMTVKTLVSGRSYDMAIVERSAASSSGNVELVDALKPRKRLSAEERVKVWSQYASDEQKNAANQIYQAARAAGRRLNRDDFRKLYEIERSIKIPENTEQRK